MPNNERDDSSGSIKEIARREFCRRWALRLGIAVVLVIAAAVAFRGYGELRKQNLARQTQQFVERGDYQSAVLVARRLLELDPKNLIACRAMAEMAEKSGSADALTWRTRIAHLEPGVVANQLALARTALRVGRPGLADTVLRAVPEAARNGAEYHQVSGMHALAQRDPVAAERHFAAAHEAEPANPQVGLHLQVIRLAAGGAGAAEARTSLAELAKQSGVRPEALRALTSDALARQDRQAAINWATQLQAEPRSTFADALLNFQAVESTDAAAPALEALKAKAAESPRTAAELISWLNRNGMAIVADHWSKQLPKEIAAAQPVPLAIAETYSFRREWSALRDWVESNDWGDYNGFRLAVLSHALRRLTPSERPTAEAQAAWRSALKLSQKRPERLLAMAQLAEGWGYTSDAEEAWWMVADGNEQTRNGLTALQRLYRAKQDTRGLFRVARRAFELNPGDLVAANNCANFGLLLTGDSTSRRLAAKLHADHPTNSTFAATYAFALKVEGKLEEALKLMETLDEEQLRHPSIAPYYVVMLVESGNIERARSYLVHAKRATLLPEEQQLLTAATRKLLASEAAGRAKTVADS